MGAFSASSYLVYNADVDVDDGGGNGDGREVVDNADSDKVDYDDVSIMMMVGMDSMIMMLLMILKQCFL